MNQEYITVLLQLNLNGMVQAQLQQQGIYQALWFEERLQLLMDHEQQSRDNRKQQRLLTGACGNGKTYLSCPLVHCAILDKGARH